VEDYYNTMKLRKIQIHNYRSINQVEISVGNSLALVGPNNVGKSNILSALNLVLSKRYPTYTSISIDDFHKRRVFSPIKIFLTFSGLDEEERKHFRAKNRGYMRKKGGQSVRYNYSENLSVCLELPFEEPAKFYFVGDDSVPLRYGNHIDGREIFVKSEDRNYFPHLVLIPGLRDAGKYFSDSTRYAWGEIIGNLRGQVNTDEEVKKALKDLTARISKSADVQNLNNDIKTYLLEFLTDEHKTIDIFLLPTDPGDLLKTARLVIDDGFECDLGSKGDGVQSLAVIALLILAAKSDKKLIIGLEEPELFLHPSALFVLNTAMQKKSTEGQVIYSSHSPFLINVTRPKYIARVFKHNSETGVVQLTEGSHWLTPRGEDEVERDIDAQRNLLFFARAVVLVEGPTEYLSLPTFADKMGIDLAKKGIILVEVNGKPNLARYSRYLSGFEIPHVIVYDIDTEGSSLNKTIEAISAPSFPMDFDFEEMLIADLTSEAVNALLTNAYGEIFTQYKSHHSVRDFSLREQVRRFLTKAKPFASKNIAEAIDADSIPETIRNIIRGAVALVE